MFPRGDELSKKERLVGIAVSEQVGATGRRKKPAR